MNLVDVTEIALITQAVAVVVWVLRHF